MPETTLELYSDLTQRKLTDSTGAAVTLPPLYQGDTLVCTIQPLDKDSLNNNQVAPRNFNVRSLAATIGLVLTPPTAGTWSVKAPDPNNPGSYLSVAALDFASSAAEVVTAFNTAFESAGWTATCTIPMNNGTNVPCIWVVSLSGVASSPVSFQPVANTLSPYSFVRVAPSQDAEGNWSYEFRLIQSPFSWNEAGFTTVLADPPSVEELIAGRPSSDNTLPAQNEVQVLTLPEAFLGTYFINWNGYVSGVLSNSSGISDIAQALNGMIPDGTNPFTVTNPTEDQAYIEFGGEFGGAPQNLMTVTVNTFAPGILTFALPLDREELAAALRAVGSITAMLEITIEVVPDDADPTDETVPGVYITLCQQAVTILSKVGWNGLTALAPINFLQPTSPTNYVPYGQNQVITGQAHYFTVFSDGVHSSFAIVHGLGTVQLACPPMVAENTLPARIYAYGLDFDATIDSINQVTLRFSYVPAAGALTVCITTAGPISAFVPNITVTIAQVTGLQALLDALNTEVAVLETYVPTGGLLGSTSNSPGSATTAINIPTAAFVVPGAWLPSSFLATSLFPNATVATLATLPPAPPLYREINADSVTTFDGVLPASPSVCVVYQNTGAAVLLPGSAGRRASVLPTNGYCAWSGRSWYPLSRVPQTNSYFPSDYDQPLFQPLVFDDAFWQAGDNFQLTFTLSQQMAAANCSGQYLLVLEFGFLRSGSTPAPTSPNLSDIDWYPVPLMTQRIVLTALAQSNTYGCQLFRSTKNKLTANKQIGTAIAKADACPGGPHFVLRGRCLRLSLTSSAPPHGYAAVQISNIIAQVISS